MSENRKRIFQRIRVPLGFVFAVLFLVFAKPTPIWLLVGVTIGLFGVAIRAWASGHIRKNQELTTTGPYAYTRNPLYIGSLIMGVGLMIASGVWWLVLLFLILFLGIYLPVMNVESEELTEIFGEEYLEYSRRVPLFFPGFGFKPDNGKKFEMSLYMRYREYRALVGYFSIALVLLAKAYLLP